MVTYNNRFFHGERPLFGQKHATIIGTTFGKRRVSSEKMPTHQVKSVNFPVQISPLVQPAHCSV